MSLDELMNALFDFGDLSSVDVKRKKETMKRKSHEVDGQECVTISKQACIRQAFDKTQTDDIDSCRRKKLIKKDRKESIASSTIVSSTPAASVVVFDDSSNKSHATSSKNKADWRRFMVTN